MARARTGEVVDRLSSWLYGIDKEDRLYRRLSAPYERWHRYYTWMLLQDVMHVFPDSRRKWSVEIDGDSGDCRRMICDALSREHDHRKIEEALRDFGQECAQMMVAFGKVVYELAYTHRADDAKVTGFRLLRVHPYVRRWWREYQYVPASVAPDAEAHERTPRWIRLDPKNLVAFGAKGKRLGRIRTCMRYLDWLSDHKSFDAGLVGKVRGYDYTLHARRHDQMVARVCGPVGWDARGTYRAMQLEPFQVETILRNAEFRCDVREAIVEGVNEVLARAGSRMGWKARIALKGLESRDDIERARLILKEGSDKALVDIAKPFM